MLSLSRYFFGLVLVLGLTGGLWADYASVVAEDGPVAWWRFDDAWCNDGMTAREMTGNISLSIYHDDAMVVGAGIDQTACWFNGYKAGIDIGNDLGPLIDGAAAVTFEAWIRNSFFSDETLTQRIFATRINNASAGIDVAVYSNGGYNYIAVGARSIATDSYATVRADFSVVDEWVHLVCVINYAYDMVKFYYDGVLVSTRSISFGSSSYVYGVPTQTDQIGRTPNYEAPYRGFIDELAIYNRELSAAEILEHYNAGNPAGPAQLWVSELTNNGGTEGLFLGDPSIHRFDNGVMVATHGYFGTNKPVVGEAIIKISYDEGEHWAYRAQVADVVGGSLFEHNGALYLLGERPGTWDITIARSYNYGLTWTTPTNSTNGLLFEAADPDTHFYGGAAVPVLFANSRIYRAFEARHKPASSWADQFSAVMVSADQNSDLLNAANWTITNEVHFEPEWLYPGMTCDGPGWLEGNAVQAPDGTVVDVIRFHSDPDVNYAAILTLSADNTTLSYDPATGLIDMPGGRNKFHIQREPATGKYLALVNNNTDPSRAMQRNTLSLIASDDLRNWTHIKTIIQDNSAMSWQDSLEDIGFQYVVWEFHGDDIIFITRTSYDGGETYHNSNRITFHRLENYMQYLAPCGQWGYATMDFNQDCYVDMMDFGLFLEDWLVCTQPYASDCVAIFN